MVLGLGIAGATLVAALVLADLGRDAGAPALAPPPAGTVVRAPRAAPARQGGPPPDPRRVAKCRPASTAGPVAGRRAPDRADRPWSTAAPAEPAGPRPGRPGQPTIWGDGPPAVPLAPSYGAEPR